VGFFLLLEIAMETNVLQRGLAAETLDLPADLLTPVSAFLKLRPAGARFLLESAESAGSLGRHSFIGFGRTRVEGRADGTVTVTGPAGEQTLPQGLGLGHVRALVEKRRTPVPVDFGLLGGAVGTLSWDFVRLLERLEGRDAGPDPVFRFLLVDSLVAFDHFLGRAMVLSLGEEGREEQAREKNREIATALAGPPVLPRPGAGGPALFVPRGSREEFLSGVRRAKEYIRQGEIFQVVLSRSEEARITADPFQIYRALRMSNPSPYMFYLDFDGLRLVGSSPEMLVKLTGRRAQTCPIAGTRGRGGTREEDERLARELLHDEKECAEHVMLVDLARNDLGRSCDFGSVEVERLMKIEKFSHVQHIVSDVAGRIRPDVDAASLLQACFPAGTVSGAPKVRAMEIIDELEAAGRGPYAGCVGYLAPNGEMDSCITIRTVVVEGDRARVQAGAGIVADSDPEREYAETEKKMAVLKEAVRSAEEGEL
jgi:anthranilate synthase component 1